MKDLCLYVCRSRPLEPSGPRLVPCAHDGKCAQRSSNCRVVILNSFGHLQSYIARRKTIPRATPGQLWHLNSNRLMRTLRGRKQKHPDCREGLIPVFFTGPMLSKVISQRKSYNAAPVQIHSGRMMPSSSDMSNSIRKPFNMCTPRLSICFPVRAEKSCCCCLLFSLQNEVIAQGHRFPNNQFHR